MTSACDVFESYPDRFLGYLLADPKVRKTIIDENSFERALRSVLQSDSSLSEILQTMQGAGEELKVCASAVFEKPEIQDLIRVARDRRRREFRKRVKTQHPEYKRGQITKEVNRRVKISDSLRKIKIPKPVQITIQEATKPVSVTGYTRDTRDIKTHSRTMPRPLTNLEKRFFQNNINKNPKIVIARYYDAGLRFRSPESIRKQLWRIRKKRGR